jgi:hypothetical protein
MTSERRINMELKPCPFCGNTQGNGMGISSAFKDKVYCQCGCLKPLQGWNARPLEDALRKKLEELLAKDSKPMLVTKDGQRIPLPTLSQYFQEWKQNRKVGKYE